MAAEAGTYESTADFKYSVRFSKTPLIMPTSATTIVMPFDQSYSIDAIKAVTNARAAAFKNDHPGKPAYLITRFFTLERGDYMLADTDSVILSNWLREEPIREQRGVLETPL